MGPKNIKYFKGVLNWLTIYIKGKSLPSFGSLWKQIFVEIWLTSILAKSVLMVETYLFK